MSSFKRRELMMVVNALVRCSAWLLFGKLRLLIGKNKRGTMRISEKMPY